MKRSNRLLFGSVKNIVPLLLGIIFLQLASGLQGTLIGVRAAIEDFSTLTIGLFMSMYYAGFLFGARKAPDIIQGIGHPRMFAAMASISSVTILFHFISVDPFVWLLMRALNGFAFAGLFVAAESWLNDMARPRVRGQVISIYMMIQYLFLAVGYNLVNLAEPTEAILYMMVSVLISISLIPVLLTTGKTPRFATPEPLPVKELFKITPLSAVGGINMGLTHSTVFTMGIIFFQDIGVPTAEATLTLSAFIVAGAIMQWPAGLLSDKFDRRAVIALFSLFSAAAMLAVEKYVGQDRGMTMGAMALYGIGFLPLYGMILASMNDRLRPSQMVGATSTLYIIYGLSSIAGPLVCSFMMEKIGTSGFTIMLCILHGMMGLYTIWRIFVSDAIPAEQQGHSLPALRIGTGVTPLLKHMIKSTQAKVESSRTKRRTKRAEKEKKKSEKKQAAKEKKAQKKQEKTAKSKPASRKTTS